MADQRVYHELEPVYDVHSRILILGSFPSVVSRKQQFYYANPTNRFWPVLAKVFEEEIADRRAFCLSHGIALWDVIASCVIHGSSDASIKEVVPNDIEGLLHKTQIKAIVTTGGKAAALYRRYITTDAVPHIALPSTSAANASMRMERLVKEYQIVRTITEEN